MESRILTGNDPCHSAQPLCLLRIEENQSLMIIRFVNATGATSGWVGIRALLTFTILEASFFRFFRTLRQTTLYSQLSLAVLDQESFRFCQFLRFENPLFCRRNQKNVRDTRIEKSRSDSISSNSSLSMSSWYAPERR